MKKGICHHDTYAAQPMLHRAPPLLVVEDAVVAVPLHAVIVMQDVEVIVVDDKTETTCVQEGKAEAEQEDDEDEEDDEPEDDEAPLL